jgi:hypothetical protein
MTRLRICIYCHKVGITQTFETGNELRRHVRTRHPRNKEQRKKERQSIRQYRIAVLKMHAKYGLPQ